MSEFVFNDRPFRGLPDIKKYLELKEDEAKTARKVWLEELADPIDRFSHILDLAYDRDRIKDKNPYPLYITEEIVTRSLRVSSDLLHQGDLNDSTDYIDISETRTRKGELSYANIRMMYSMIIGGTPPPWEQEVYSLVMRPSRSEFIWKSNDHKNFTPLYDDSIDIPEPPELLVQPSYAFLQWEGNTKTVPSEIGIGSHIFRDENIGKKVFIHGIERIAQVLRNPLSICESYEYQPIPKGAKKIPLVKKICL